MLFKHTSRVEYGATDTGSAQSEGPNGATYFRQWVQATTRASYTLSNVYQGLAK